MQYTYFASSKEKGSIRGRLSNVCNVLDQLYEQLNTVSVTIAALEAQGVSEGSIHWRRRPEDGKPGILELLHPQEGEYTRKAGRRREYIGTDPDRQQEALARVKRWKALQDAKSEQRRIRDRMGQLENMISSLELAARAEQLRFGDTWLRSGAAQRPQENE